MFRAFALLPILFAALLPATAVAQQRHLIDARGTANLEELAR
jgi:hypothetical protein